MGGESINKWEKKLNYKNIEENIGISKKWLGIVKVLLSNKQPQHFKRKYQIWPYEKLCTKNKKSVFKYMQN